MILTSKMKASGIAGRRASAPDRAPADLVGSDESHLRGIQAQILDSKRHPDIRNASRQPVDRTHIRCRADARWRITESDTAMINYVFLQSAFCSTA